jgi:endonuclease/exonuclease/phosphatase family metal-dependent hydrolase
MGKVLDQLNKLTASSTMWNSNVFALPAIVMGDFNTAVGKTTVRSEHTHKNIKCGNRHDRLVRYTSPVYTPLIDHPTCCIGDPTDQKKTHRLHFDNIVVAPGACEVLRATSDQSNLGMLKAKKTERYSSDHLPVAARLTITL